jgi:tripartite-type tricarboxylate transporter receptor subunit TctC
MTPALRIVGSCVAVLAIGSAASARAQQPAYPVKPLRFIAPFPPGGSTDVLSRILAQKLSDALGRQVVVENRPGAGGNLGHEVAAKTAPDGYTLVMSSNVALATNPHLYKRLGFDPLNDFAPISVIAKAGPVLVVHPSLPVRSVKELIALAKSRPGQLNFGSGGRGTPAHVVGEIFKAETGINIVHVAYKGGVLAVNDLVGGQIEMVFADMAPAVPHIQVNRLRALAVTSEERSKAIPSVPTMVEAGVRLGNTTTWWAILAPKGTPVPIIARLNSELAKIMQLPDVQERYATLGLATLHTPPERVMEWVKQESPVMGKVLKAAGVEPE